jgi:hypothetical protein
MSKYVTTLLMIVAVSTASEWVSLDGMPESSPPTITILENDANSVVLNIKLHGFFKEDTVVDDTTYQQLLLPQEFYSNEIGTPMTPAIKKLIQIPPISGTSVSYSTISDTTLSGYYVFPYQYPSYRTDSMPPFEKNGYVYLYWYPDDVVKKSDPAILADLRVMTLSIYPVSFSGALEELYVIKEMNVTISFSGTDTINVTGPPPIIRSDRLDLFYRSQILNYEPQVDTPIVLGGPYWADVDFHVFVPDNYYEDINDYLFWRNKCGYTVKVYKLSEIPGYTGQPGDTSIIRNYIKNNCYTLGYNNTVLLIGDENDIPFYWEWSQPSTYFPSDHYYSLIRGTDEYADINIGRLYVKSSADLAVFMHKIFRYERYQTPEPEWFPGTNHLFHGQDGIMRYAKQLVRYNVGVPGTITMLSNNPSPVVQSINDGGGLGAINYLGHGFHDRWLQTQTCVFFTASDIQNLLSNENAYPVVCNMACHNGAIQETTPCMLEAWTLAPLKGAVAAIGATAKCYGMSASPKNLLTRMDTTIWHEFAIHQAFKYRHPLGLGLWKSKNLMVEIGDAYSKNNARVYWLDGDPELTKWHDSWGALICEYPSKLYKGENEITITVKNEYGMGVYKALVCLYKPNDVQLVLITDNEGQATTTFYTNNIGTLHVTARAPVYWPYEGTIDVVNKDIENIQNMSNNKTPTEFGISKVRMNKEYVEIYFGIDQNRCHVSLTIYDVTGRLVKGCYDETAKSGKHCVKWSYKDAIGKSISSGTYFCRLQDLDGNRISTKKIVIP